MQDLFFEEKRLLLEPVPLQRLASTTNRISIPKMGTQLEVVGLISDTHIPTRANAIPKKVLEVFKDSSLIRLCLLLCFAIFELKVLVRLRY